jgi:cephalosporin hydroxylase
VESLHEIGLRHGTDKATERRNLLGVYDGFLAPLRDEPINLLEIGVLGGASIRTWRDYFRNGRIVGIDIDPKAAEYAEDGVSIHIGDQTDPKFLEMVADREGPFDVVIDDGAHTATAQIGSLVALWPHVRSRGVYIVEDTHTSYMQEYEMGWRREGTTVEFLKDVIDDLHERWHDQPVALRACSSVCFFEQACIIRKRQV